MTFFEFQILLVAILGLLVLIPVALCWRLLARTGRSGWPAVLLAVPVVNLVVTYALAFRRAETPARTHT